MTFQEYYIKEKEAVGGSMPTAFLQRIATAAIVSTDTAYQWATGWRNPSNAAAELVSRELGIPVDELFPNRKRKAVAAVMVVAGLLLAVCTMDGSAYEIPVRFAGVGLVAAGGFVGNLFRKEEKR